ncbi:MAG: hypothetical protein K9K30_11450 [Burkholderiaceae bacterium]|nr:hypothetical protein [Sulfuritalea sp.]MCF8175843.1 hypothetical protein [Burkholderiaceae bacterium]
MALSELQIALIGAGIVAIALVWGYNAWQDRKHRKTADRIFKSSPGDVLLGNQEIAGADQPLDETHREMHREPGERQEPRFTDEVDEVADVDELDGAMAAAEPAGEDLPELAPEPQSKPMLPEEWADAVADCVLRMAAPNPIPAPTVWALLSAWSEESSKAVHCLAHDEEQGRWLVVAADTSGHYREWAVALQLVDRRGPVSDAELGTFLDSMQQIAQQTGAELEQASLAETLARARALDEFCAAVDIQFVLHVVEASGGVFAGTKLRGVAEAAGLLLEADGVFRQRDAVGMELFTVANLGDEPFAAESIKSLATHGLTLSLDVPRVSDGVQAFNHMLATARQLSDRLGGVVVDAQRAPLADAMIDAIRAKSNELQQRMRDGGIVPGSTRALRLFS